MPAAPLPVVFTREQALAAGYGRHRMASRLRSGEWRRLAAGVYCTALSWETASRRGRCLLHGEALQRRSAGAVLSHLSAAAVWGWPLPLDDPLSGWLTHPPGTGTRPRRKAAWVVEVATLGPEDVHDRDGRPVTSPARTVANWLRHLSGPDAVAVADAAGRSGLSRSAIEAVLASQASWLYGATGRSAMRLVDPRRESWSVVRLHQRGIPLPQPQVTVTDVRGRFVARVDWWWPDRGVVAEADRRDEYRRAGLRAPEDAERRLREEKEREDRLRDAGLEVVRYGTRDVALDELVARLRRAFDRGDPSRLRGRIARMPMPRGRIARMPMPRGW